MQKKSVVLVVEDNFLIRMDAVQMVVGAGYEALQAGTADKAVSILLTRDDIDLVFTDVNMPGMMDGRQLALYVHRRHPNVGIIVASGTLVVEMDTLPEGAHFFTKPYSDQEITAAMAALLVNNLDV